MHDKITVPVINGDRIWRFATIWMGLEAVMLPAMHQAQKAKYPMISFTHELQGEKGDRIKLHNIEVTLGS